MTTQPMPEGARLQAGQGGLESLVIDTPLARAQIYLLGANVTAYQPTGQAPVIWLSGKSLFQPGKAIRGGIPICWPWFGPKADDPKAPQHGFARARPWTLEQVRAEADGAITAVLGLGPADDTRALWPHAFAARYTVTVGKQLSVELSVQNPGSEAFSYEEALHTYLVVKDVREATLTGLEGTTYIDKNDGARRKPEGSAPIQLTGATDRVYLGTQATCVLTDPGLKRRIRVSKSGSSTTVVWNPWAEKARAMADFGDDEWPGMICVETANAADHPVQVPAGGSHATRAVIEVEPL